MGMGWQEWPLMLFTVLGQCVVGGVIVMGLAIIGGNLNEQQRRAVHRAMFFLWLLMGIAFIASTLHLGSPWRAFNSLNRIGASALSNEIAAGALFFAVGGCYWLLAVLGKIPPLLGRVWLWVTMVLGLVFVYMMTRVYQIDTVPTWHNGYTTLSFFLTVPIGGPMLGVLLLRFAGLDVTTRHSLATLSVVALLVSLGTVMMQGYELASISSSVQQASALIPQYGQLMVGRLVLVVLGLGCWICPLLRRGNASVMGMALGLILVIAGELVGRGVFYGLHMTVGMAVAG
ncbi:TPA: dimethyl sulfoxide reductase anchor subunit family protein [Serratia liquefaciens]|uniref:dimethyl sulfoxide reductase anchor subunit family protein n=1 Tax=Serratia liquefaciens TaxID=614 RepID=UPI00165CF4A8|nr:dimethyl sulfoxide reductase anchor subunit family protein [Serratia liquefaciens]QNQ56010.1 dimethyl sulfoxide reductase anchor subunit family protein [Serratia liquefaciens]HEJ8088279.1 dimethyl sulfoxide reductase anchor subunit family protein [Serratia liquefaciens]